MVKRRSQQVEMILDALKEEHAAAAVLAEAMEKLARAAHEKDGAGLRRLTAEAKERFSALAKASAYRHSVVAALAQSRELDRDTSLADLIEGGGEELEPLRAPAHALLQLLEKVQKAMVAQSLWTSYGTAMVGNLIELYGKGRTPVAYGASGQRTATYTQAGKVA